MLVCSIFSTLQIAERAVFIAGIDALYILFYRFESLLHKYLLSCSVCHLDDVDAP